MSNFLVVAILVSIVTYSNAQQDLTLVAGQSGVDVVDACINKLSAIPLFSNDFGFLKRIALVESDFGSNTTTINVNPAGGIWQISTTINQAISGSTTLAAVLTQARLLFGTDITDFVNGDFSIPLKSALAAKLYIELISVNGEVPGTVTEQATWWTRYYNENGQISVFETTVTNYESENKCTVSKMDLYFLLDGSGSIGSSNFQQSLDFVKQLASEFNISSEQVRTGLTIYSSSNYPISQFDQHQNNSAFSDAVINTNYPRGGTQTGNAIEFVRTTMFNTTTGMRPLTDGAPRILIVLTDGESSDDVVQPSKAIKEDGITVFGVGVGSGYVEDEIHAIASDPDSDYAFGLSQFDQLVTILEDRVSVQACKIPTVFPDDTEVPISVGSGDTHYSEVQMPTNGSIELSYSVTTVATAIVYASSSTTNPNSAVYDFFFELQLGVTVVTMNSGETSTSAVELVSNTYASSSFTTGRKKRAVDTTDTFPVYLAVVPTSNEPLDATVKATGSNTRASGGAGSGVYKFSWMTALLLAMFAYKTSL
ncbi:uncharacterized protein LOC143446634 [Clavelina lepadiformis]|uniref:uncharacterized protein LOC143446634 n=1 Tax=Clavelina lepadiformis TaxID=159417 RepID=UPI0040437C1C